MSIAFSDMSSLQLKTGILLSLISYISALAVNRSIRLYGGSFATEGDVQVFVEDEWKTICNDGWDAVDALVACRELGFTDGYAMIWSKQSYSRWHYGTTAPSTDEFPTEGNDFNCNGNEESLLSCKYTQSRTHCSTLAGVACGITEAKYNILVADFNPYGDSDPLAYTVNVSNGNSGGRVLSTSRGESDNIYLAGGLCDMDDRAAMLLCKEQGYINGGKKSKVPTLEGLPMVISKLTCLEAHYVGSCDIQCTSTGVCPDGTQYNGVKCHTTVARSVIRALAFAGVASILIIIAGACGIRWIRKDPKIPHVTLNMSESEPDDDISSPSHSEI